MKFSSLTATVSLSGMLLWISSCLSVHKNTSGPQATTHSTTGQTAGVFTKALVRSVQIQYLLYQPEEYRQSKQRFPLLVYLHGGSARGEDINKLRTSGLPALLETDPHFPFLVLSPLCPKGEIWTDTATLEALLEEIMAHYRIDSNRIYLTGHSMGGRGTWYWAYKHPRRFAAIVPVSPLSTIDAWADSLKAVPVWAIHGAKDEIAPIGNSETLVNALRKMGGEVKFTVLPEADHYILDTYEQKELYTWLLQHHR